MNLKLKERKKENKKLIDFKSRRKKWEMNLGILMFLVFFIYIIGISVNYFTSHNISTYEVNYGSIIDDTAYTGLAIRSEEVFTAGSSGYIQFYNSESSRVSYGNYIYTISSTNTDIIQQTDSDTENYTLSNADQASILSAIQSFNSSYDSLVFSDSYDLSDYITSVLQNSELDEKISALEEIGSYDGLLEVYTADSPGIVVYKIDGYEDITIESFSASNFDKSNYNVMSFSTGDKIVTNDSVFKLITDEAWYIIIQLNDEDIDTFEDMSKVDVRFVSDDETVSCDFSLISVDNISYGMISLNTNMIRYATERFIDIELVLDELEGFKIPISSVISRDFYAIPLEYITKGGEYSSNGVIVYNVDGSVTFVETNVYYQDSTYGYVAVTDEIENQTIIMEETSDRMKLTEAVELNGVYSVNKGYAEFKYVSILTASSEYYIVDSSTSYSISNYDRIALYGDSVEENLIIN